MGNKSIKCEPGKIKVSLGGFSIKIESNHVLNSRRKLCEELISKTDLTENDFLEFLLALHFVLEIGINTFFRNYYSISSKQNPLRDENELDEINYIDKVRFFINANNFLYKDGESVEISKINAIRLLEDLKSFGRNRNMIIHGHSVSEVTCEETKQSKLKNKLNSESLDKQIKSFKDILRNLNYFIDILETNVNKDQMLNFQKSFLSDEFLNNYTNS